MKEKNNIGPKIIKQISYPHNSKTVKDKSIVLKNRITQNFKRNQLTAIIKSRFTKKLLLSIIITTCTSLFQVLNFKGVGPKSLKTIGSYARSFNQIRNYTINFTWWINVYNIANTTIFLTIRICKCVKISKRSDKFYWSYCRSTQTKVLTDANVDND